MKNRVTAMLLILAMLASAVLTSCSQDGTGDDTTASDTTADTTTAETTAETEPVTPYSYITKTWDGKTYTMCTPDSGTRYIPGQFITEEETGDIIMDGAYQRNMLVSENLDVTFEHVMIPRGSFASQLRTEIQADTEAYDLVTGFCNNLAPLMSEGIFASSEDLPYQADISEKSWYNANMNEALQVNGKQYMFFSDMVCITLSCTYGMFYNVSLGETFGIEDVDQLALDGKWTLDKLYEYTENVSVDMNNDGVWDKNDQYGLGQYGDLVSWTWADTAMTYTYGFGEKTAVLDADGNPEIVLNSDRIQSVIETLNDLFWTGNRRSTVTGGDACTAFAEGKVLFFNAIIMHAANYMRDMSDTFVIIPMPKWDDNQEEYYTTVSYSSSVMEMIPLSAEDYEFSSAVYDALAYEGQQTVIPAFFEYSMKLKFSADNKASQLFDVVRAGTVVDFGMLYDGGAGLYQLPAKLIGTNSNNFASEFASIRDLALANFNKVVESLSKNN